MDARLTSLAEHGPLAATLLADHLLEHTWIAGAPETWFASPFIVVLAYALAMSTRGDSEAIERLTTAVRSRLGACAAAGLALRELRALCGARDALVAVDGVSSPTLLFRASTGDVRTLATHERATYFFGAPAGWASDGIVSFESAPANVPPGFRKAHAFHTLAGFAFRTGEWEARLLLLDAVARQPALRMFGGVLRQVVPATARICDLHAQKHRAAEQERARLGRELHDGIVQELTCLDMELELIGVAAAPPVGIRDRIRRVQARLRAEVSTLRKLLQDARYRDVDASRLQVVLESMVERFGRDTSVHADYVSHVSEVRLPPHVCGEIARIVQEALVNVRRHSGARHVVVTFSCDDADWKLSIQDDGRGFSARRGAPFASTPDVLPPAVIHERVHSLGGTVRVVAPGSSGARIEISGRSGAYGTG